MMTIALSLQLNTSVKMAMGIPQTWVINSYIYNALAPRFSIALKIKLKYFILPYMNSVTNGVLQKQGSVTI